MRLGLRYGVFNPKPGTNVPANTAQLWEACSSVHGGYPLGNAARL
jgi:hypothetical protein